MAKNMILDYYGATDLGRQRKNNEDSFLTAEISRRLLVQQTNVELRDNRRKFDSFQGHLLVIADGLGGHPGGEYASEAVVSAVARHVLDSMPCLSNVGEHPNCGIADELRRALADCRANVLEFARKHPRYEGLGSTLTVALVFWPTLYVLHVGDSRCYILRNGSLDRITTDQTVAQELVDAGTLPAANADRSRWSTMLVSAVDGRSGTLESEIGDLELLAGDTIVLCTDGLTGSISEEELADTLSASESPREACESLIRAANAAGGSDNITVIVAKACPERSGGVS